MNKERLGRCGGVVRDCLGNWIVGFAKMISDCQANSAEEWAIVEGLQTVWDLGFRKIILESDADYTVNLLLDNDCVSCSNLILRARELLSLNWQVDVRSISRDANRIADALAKKGISDSVILNECPSSLRNWCIQESLGLIFPLV
ncbi:hypothetical protein QN277_021805 [Acacia crassicarpa]|uniref:RNase H type-1 domain-containing protein n=1 Tax=Acacia crassicarpa TaxID=499986 RepID=A0AAE1JS08_9FABA|nr:hypothetical protein QN277_021805 [Acacia crassicarpa]